MSDNRLKRNVLWGMSTLSVAVLAFGFDAGSNVANGAVTGSTTTTTTTPTNTTDATSQAATDTTASPAASSGSGSGTSGANSASSSQTYTGEAVQTEYGPVQVQITVSGGKITAATAVEYPTSDHHDQMINSRAVPVLEDETVQAQGASIDSVSGATFTSQGYIASLQSALDQANL